MRDVLSLVKEVINGIAEECKLLTHQSIINHGYNDKPNAMKNTLEGSNLYNSVETKGNEDGLISIMVNGYIDYIESGRPPGIWPPPHAIAEWASEKGITTDNSIIYLICKSIYEEGIRARPIFERVNYKGDAPLNDNDLVFDLTDEVWDNWNEQLTEAVTANIDDWFNE